MTKSVSTQWAIRVTTDQIHKCEDAFKKYSFIGYVERLARRLKAHYHIAIQFDEPKDDNSVRYAVKKHFQVKATGYTLSRYGMVFPHTLPISTKGIPK